MSTGARPTLSPARDTGARIVRIDGGAITGPAFVDHVRRLRRPVAADDPHRITRPARVTRAR
jgi:hypothetical protein